MALSNMANIMAGKFLLVSFMPMIKEALESNQW